MASAIFGTFLRATVFSGVTLAACAFADIRHALAMSLLAVEWTLSFGTINTVPHLVAGTLAARAIAFSVTTAGLGARVVGAVLSKETLLA